MDCLLLGGAPDVGKTKTLIRLYFQLVRHFSIPRSIRKGLPQQAHKLPNGKKTKDFMWILDVQNNENKTIRIIINTAADDAKSIKAFKKFFDDNFGEKGYDILISPIRDIDDRKKMRSFFLNTMNINHVPKLEIPFGKVREKSLRPTAEKWHKEQMDNLINHTLKNTPFNL